MVANSISRSSIQYQSGFTSMVPVDYSGGDVNLAKVCRGLSCNVTGTIVLIFADDTVPVTRIMNPGVDYPWAIKTIKNSGTTAGMGINAGY